MPAAATTRVRDDTNFPPTIRKGLRMKSFHHIGLVANEPKPGEMYFESLKVWGTNPDDDPGESSGMGPLLARQPLGQHARRQDAPRQLGRG